MLCKLAYALAGTFGSSGGAALDGRPPTRIYHNLASASRYGSLPWEDGYDTGPSAMNSMNIAWCVSALVPILPCVLALLFISDLVRRAERAAERAENAARRTDPSFAVVGRDSDNTMMRMAARWGADVLSAVANGTPGPEAVRRAVPRVAVGLSSVPEDAASEVSSDELPATRVADPNDWIAHASQAVTPVPDLQRSMEEAHRQQVWNAAGTTFIPGIHDTRAILRPVAAHVRPRSSPTHD